jgi:hypothetical protein
MGSDHLMTVTGELRSEPGADSTLSPHDEDLHRALLSGRG